MSRILINSISGLAEGLEPAKGLDWMLKLQKGEVLDLDRSDSDLLKRLISNNFKGMSLIVRARLLEVFDHETA